MRQKPEARSQKSPARRVRNFRCLLCGKIAYPEVCEGKITMFNSNGQYHKCRFKKVRSRHGKSK